MWVCYRTLPFPTPVCTMDKCRFVTVLSLSPYQSVRLESVGLLPHSPFSHTGLYDGQVWVCYRTLPFPTPVCTMDKCGSVTVPYSPFLHTGLHDGKLWVCYHTLPFPTPVCKVDKCRSVTVLSLFPHRFVRWECVGLLLYSSFPTLVCAKVWICYRTLPFPPPFCTKV